MTIFMIIRKLRYSGAYKMFMWLATMLSRNGHHVIVCTWANNDVKSLPKEIEWIQLDLERRCFFRIARSIRRELRKTKADISISFLLDGNVYNVLACIRCKTKSIICERNDPFKPGYNKLRFFIPLLRKANGAVFQLPEVARYYNLDSEVAIIPNPVIPISVHISPFISRPNIISVLGRLDVFQKRHDIMVRAFALFIQDNPTFKLIFYGDGPDLNYLKSLVRSYNLEDSVYFAGITNEPIEVLKNSKMFVLTSDFEGIPNSLIEAMSVGLPCIATRCRPGGAELLIADGINGFLVPRENPMEIAKRMSILVNDPALADRIGTNAKAIVDRFNEERVYSMWEEYIKVLYNL